MRDADHTLFRLAVEALELAVIIDTQGVICHVGREYAGILGYNSAREIEGKHILEVIPHTGLLNILKTGRAEFDSVFILKNNRPVVVNRYPIRDETGALVGAISIAGIPDLSRFKELNNKITKLLNENILYKTKLDELQDIIAAGNIIGHSEKISQVKEFAQKIADSDITVLLTGETGTGKEVFANYIKSLSYRRLESFVKINCAAIPKELLESELFGYSEGSFSGAKKGGKKGRFEVADGGTILLDEIGEMPFDLQAKLLRVLQEKEIDGLGSLKPKKINVRLICATNQNLHEQVRKKLFREDLYYRINVLEIEVPPLRERLDDIPLLCAFFIKKINSSGGSSVEGVSDDVIALLCQYDWPGNIRELEHVLERAAIMSHGGILGEADFEFFKARLKKKSFPPPPPVSNSPLNEKKRHLEKNELAAALAKTGGNKSKAAKLLKMPRSVLYEKIKTYGLDELPP